MYLAHVGWLETLPTIKWTDITDLSQVKQRVNKPKFKIEILWSLFSGWWSLTMDQSWNSTRQSNYWNNEDSSTTWHATRSWTFCPSIKTSDAGQLVLCDARQIFHVLDIWKSFTTTSSSSLPISLRYGNDITTLSSISEFGSLRKVKTK